LVIFKGVLRDDNGIFWACESAELFDLETGEERSIATCSGGRWDCWQLQRGFWWGESPGARRPEAWRFFLDERHALVRWDPDTDTLTTIAGGAE
jgi:hypothetical protein